MEIVLIRSYTGFRRIGPLALVILGLFAATSIKGQTGSASERIANSIMHSNSGRSPTTWDGEVGTELEGMDAEWYNTANGDYFHYLKRITDSYLDANPGLTNIQAPDKMGSATLGRMLLLLYRVNLSDRYYEAAKKIREQVAGSCGITEKDVESKLSTGDTTVCAAEPFLAEYASVFLKSNDFKAITKDFLHWNEVVSDLDGRAHLAAALVDSLAYYPTHDSGQARLMTLLNHTVTEMIGKQVGTSGSKGGIASVRQVIQPAAACLYVYAVLKGVRLGYLPRSYAAAAEQTWRELKKSWMKRVPGGDRPGKGAMLLAATEAEQAPTATFARGETVTLDGWYNSQQRKNAAGQMESFHYKWDDKADSGYALLGHMFRSYGAATNTLDSSPTRDKLRDAQFYIIVSPDIPIKNPNPHYMTERDAGEIAAWVHDGGELILMENDPPNADITHLNLLADRFGIHFDDVLKHHILGEQVEHGTIPVSAGGPLFHARHTLYMKDTCAISLHGKATALLRDRGDVVMATAKYGRGTVFAMVDPWLYNEYTDGRKNPQIYGKFDNFGGGKELVRWLLEQRPGAGAEKKLTNENTVDGRSGALSAHEHAGTSRYLSRERAL